MFVDLPVARAGPSFQACMSNGKFQGMICPQTPIGSCLVYVKKFPPTGIVLP